MGLKVLSPTTISMLCDGDTCTAELREDGRLHWDDGDIWEKLEHASDAGPPQNKSDSLSVQPLPVSTKKDTPLSTPGAKLQIQLGHGWVDCGKDETSAIRNQLEGGEVKFTIEAKGVTYVVDFTDMANPTQTNSRSRKSRDLRIVMP